MPFASCCARTTSAANCGTNAVPVSAWMLDSSANSAKIRGTPSRGCFASIPASCVPPTVFGKTVAAAALIARRGVNTLVLVHSTELLRQWQERLQTFLGCGKDMVGIIGGGKSRPTGRIDIAVMQSLHRQGETNPIVENYGHVIIIDECHHLSAVSFEAILKRVRACYVLGFTATLVRRDDCRRDCTCFRAGRQGAGPDRANRPS